MKYMTATIVCILLAGCASLYPNGQNVGKQTQPIYIKIIVEQ